MKKEEQKNEKELKPIIKKLIELPRATVVALTVKAKADKRLFKSYVEKVLIEHGDNPFKK